MSCGVNLTDVGRPLPKRAILLAALAMNRLRLALAHAAALSRCSQNPSQIPPVISKHDELSRVTTGKVGLTGTIHDPAAPRR